MTEPDAPVGLGPIHHESAPLRARIIEAMRDAIERGILTPGERLVEKTLCERLGVSRTSLREALRELESERIITSTVGRGLTVARLSARDAQNIYAIRADLEALVAAQFVERADPAALARAVALYDDAIGCYRAGDFAAIVAAKRAILGHLCAVAENAVAHEMLAKLTLRTAQLRRASVERADRQAQSIAELQAMKAALIARDRAAAQAAARAHVQNASLTALAAAPAPDERAR